MPMGVRSAIIPRDGSIRQPLTFLYLHDNHISWDGSVRYILLGAEYSVGDHPVSRRREGPFVVKASFWLTELSPRRAPGALCCAQ